MGLSDQALITQVVVDNDHGAFQQLLDRHQGKIRGLLLRLTAGNHADADDMAQEVFIRVYKYLPAFLSNAKFETWIYRIAYNVFYDFIRSDKLKIEQETDQPPKIDNSQCPSQGLDFYQLLGFLNREERWIFLMHYEKGYTHSEIADITRCPLGTVKSHIARGKEKLKRYVSDE